MNASNANVGANMGEHRSSPSVVVGIDGSRSAVDAALWAVDEAVSRDIPLRLVYAIDPERPPDRTIKPLHMISPPPR